MMRILIIHNKYQLAGGEDAAVAAEVAALASAGHDIHLELISNDDIVTAGAKLKVFMTSPYDSARSEWASHLVDRFRPEVVHVHNFFPKVTPAVHERVAERGIAVVQTLHNYRLICAGALLLREGIVCEKCVVGSHAWGVIHRCYRGSLAGSLAVTRMQHRAKRREIWTKSVHRFIALTEFARQKFVAGGLPAARIEVKPNLVSQVPQNILHPSRHGALFVGRLASEKGVDVLMQAWARVPSIHLTILGDGPERSRLEKSAPRNVTFAGQVNQASVQTYMRSALFLIVPSICYEGFPMTIVEAFSVGLPVIASQIGSLAEIVEDGVNGLHFTPGDSEALASAARDLENDRALLLLLQDGASNSFQERYLPSKNIRKLEEIYQAAIELAGSSTPSIQPRR